MQTYFMKSVNFKQRIPDHHYALKALHIRKTFRDGQVVANDNINLFVKKNEIHAIVGENGAGKSTLMSILFGLSTPDSGKIYLYDREIHFKSAKEATKNGIGMLQQHFSLVGSYSVLENIILGAEISHFGVLRPKKAAKIITNIMKKYNLHVELKAKIDSLSIAQQQKVELLKILFRNLDIMIFDEPTASLSKIEIESFLNMLKLFKSLGHTVILISHKLDEVKEVSDNVTVIWKGRSVGRVKTAETSIDELAELMIGKKRIKIENSSLTEHFGKKAVLSVSNLNLDKKNILSSVFSTLVKKTIEKKCQFLIKKKKNESPKFSHASLTYTKNKHTEKKSISFSVHAGEIFAIAGVAGNGQEKIAEFLTGLKISKPGTIKFLEKDISREKINKRRKYGISYVPEDRHSMGLTLDDNCQMNIVNDMISNQKFSSFGFIRRIKITAHANKMIEKFDIRGTMSGTAQARALSGGNQQKIILARELYMNHKLLILVQPTRGLDIGAIQYVHEQIINEKKNNKAILLVSYELDEIFALADTIAIMRKNEFLGIYPKREMSYEKIGKLMG